MGFFARTKATVALLGALLVVLGVAILSNPVGTTVLLTRLAGVACAVFGVTALLEAVRQEGGLSAASLGSLASGVVPLAFGLFVVCAPELFVGFLFTMVGVGVLLTGVDDVSRAGTLRKLGGDLWRLPMGVGVATLVVGLAIIVAPFAAASLVPIVAGVGLVADGVSEIVLALRM